MYKHLLIKAFLYLTEGCSIKVLVIGNGEEGRGCRLSLRTVELCREGVWNCGTVRCASSLGSHQLATEGGGRATSPALGYLKLAHKFIRSGEYDPYLPFISVMA